jgi:hypothetical protein
MHRSAEATLDAAHHLGERLALGATHLLAEEVFEAVPVSP